MRHRSYDRLGCPVEACTEAIGAKWKGEIIYILLSEKKRHGELRKLMPDATQRVLTLQLRELEEDGIVERRVYPEVPPRVEYSLTKTGESLRPIIDAMWSWGKIYLDTLPKNRFAKKVEAKGC